jgi:trehalose 6-phosphate synthase
VDRTLEVRIKRQDLDVVRQQQTTLVRPYPISIEWPGRWSATLPDVATCRREVRAALSLPADARMVVSVDRLDYTKGMEERLLTIEQALERWPDNAGALAFVQVGAPSRTASSATANSATRCAASRGSTRSSPPRLSAGDAD